MESPESTPFPKQSLPPPPPAHMQAPAAQSKDAVEHITKADADILRQLRVLEDRYVNLRRKAQLTDENLLSQEQHVQKEIRSLTDELTEIRRQLASVKQGLLSVEGELGHCATIYDIKTIEKYLQYWEPLGFVTQTELSRRRNEISRAASSRDEKFLKQEETDPRLSRNLLKEPAGRDGSGAR